MLSLVHIISFKILKSEFSFKKAKKMYISSPKFISSPVTTEQWSMQWNPQPGTDSSDKQQGFSGPGKMKTEVHLKKYLESQHTSQALLEFCIKGHWTSVRSFTSEQDMKVWLRCKQRQRESFSAWNIDRRVLLHLWEQEATSKVAPLN